MTYEFIEWWVDIVQSVKTRDVVAYMTMPRIVPRFKGLFSSGFAYIAFLMAHIYAMVRLLPENHPYLATENIGKFGIWHTVTEASRNLKFSFKHIDQVIIYFAMLAAFVMLVAQIAILIYAVLVSPALATSLFDTPNPTNDIAYNILDRVFGVPGLFCSTSTGTCTAYAGSVALPLPFHIGLQGLFRFYSTGLLLIAVLIFLYFVVVIVLETAVTGSPFGQRFQNVWVPIRLVVALGLLMPINYGLNSGQYIVLYTAKYGSSFATVGWREYNTAVASHSMFGVTGPDGAQPTGEKYTVLSLPEAPDITPLIESMSLVHACAYAYHRLNAGNSNVTTGATGDRYTDINANYTNFGSGAGSGGGGGAKPTAEGMYQIQPFFVKTRTASMNTTLLAPSISGNPETRAFVGTRNLYKYTDALGFYYGSDIIIRFGEYKEYDDLKPVYTHDTGGVKPLCGDIRITVPNLSDPGGAESNRGGPDHMLRSYYDMVLEMWFDNESMRQFARSYVVGSLKKDVSEKQAFCSGNETGGGGATLSGTGSSTPGFWPSVAECVKETYPQADWKQEQIRYYQDVVNKVVLQAWRDYVENSTYAALSADTISRGWGGAGIWYNKIAEINGGWIDGVNAVPLMDRYPMVMDQIRKDKMQNNENIEGEDQFSISLKALSGEQAPGKVEVGLGAGELNDIGFPLSNVYRYWNHDVKDFDNLDRVQTQNIVTDAMNLLFGTSGLVAMRGANAQLHPLAQLVAVGKGLIDSAIVNMAGSSASAFLGGMTNALKKYKGVAGLLDAASKMFYSLAFIGITAGFVLFYVLPFLPFVYFYFAVGSWVKAIFEAMVGVPLWALAHLRIDGEGLPGDAAQNGYFLILEIFIRPILTVIGLIAAVTIFAAQVRILNLVWDLVSANISGFTNTNDILGMANPKDARFHRTIVDQFFFTLIYTIVCYMLALSSFKLIDKIPDNILRWAGSGVSAYGDIDQDNIESLNRYAAVGGMTIGNQAAGAVRDAAGGVGGVLGGEMAKLSRSSTPKGK